MAISTSQPALGHTMLLFGPQFLSFTADSLSRIRWDWLESPRVQEWVLRTLSELPHHWTTLTAAFPALKQLPGEQQLQDLVDSICTGRISKASFPLPNLTLCPLVVLTQLTQYLRYRDLTQPQLNQAWQNTADTESVGFCIGILSALAVSCSHTRQQLERHGAAAVRLAMLVGAIVDSADILHHSTGGSISLSTVWHSPDGKVELDRIVESFPGVYVSVTYDENRATVTSPRKSSSLLIQKLKDAGITTVEIGLQGRFHDPESRSGVQTVIEFCDSHADFSLPNVSHLTIPTRHQGDQLITEGSLHGTALQAILVDHCDWNQTFAAAQSRFADSEGSIISFGLERCVPPSYLPTTGHRLLHMADLDPGTFQLKLAPDQPLDAAKDYIAVVGMSCRVPGASDLEEFWSLLCENKSQHVEVPDSRFSFETAWRDVDPDRKWFGNFIQDFEAFDNKFFHRSPREAASMDPQQKMMLQAAYQAVQQSGYFRSSATSIDKHIGCYIGVSNVDYQDNVACYPANAFTATGTLMSFVAGKVSHYFGWTGPAMSIDTACSGSAVAIHEACRAILSGECASALAGGVNAITSPLWFQNLAGASFLSTTGQCKPFAYNGDGYCRGEGVGAVFLKRLSNAIADGDQIFGVIAATAVHQNQNCTPITVPNSASLSNLFGDVLHRAKLAPQAISVVEAHGTGTAVGDPAEYESILRVLGGHNRSDTLALRSVKGLIGHAECASGMVALIKTLLMIHEDTIAPQASHDRINPALNASPSDKIEISTHSKPWNVAFKAALINNYGASGSNASMVVTEPPRRVRRTSEGDSVRSPYQPFWLCGDDPSLRAYASSLLGFLRSKRFSARNISLPNLSFSLARQSNRSLPRGLIFHSNSIQDLTGTLEAFCRGDHPALDIDKSSPPVILCFGGQVSSFVGLDRQVFERTTVLRRYLDQCNIVCKSLGLQGIYPEVFQRGAPIEDTVKLQTALFAVQYSCAMSWIECGVQVAAVVGHSFGEIVAHTVAGAMTLADGLKVIARRARVIRDSWESDRGLMMAVEADLEVVEDILARANERHLSDRPATIACFNGPRSFTLAGSSTSIQNVEAVLAADKALSSSVRWKKLGTSHAFHSTLVDSILPELKTVTQGVVFSQPRIHVERATNDASTAPLTSMYVAEHLRQPVYFNHAVQRLAKRYGTAIWLEAGSQSTVTNMAANAIGMPRSSHFQAVNLSKDDGWQRLTEATVALWKRGLNVDFWPHHSSQTAHYSPLILPPYQFEKSRHFVELKQPQRQPVKAIQDHNPPSLWTFVEYRGEKKQCARFRIETGHKTFQELMAGHTVAHSQPLCPSTLQLDIATEAIRSLCPEFPISDFQLDLRNLENQAPLCKDASREVWLDATPSNSRQIWSWSIVSNPLGSGSGETLHASGRVLFRSRDDAEFLSEFGRFERLVSYRRCQELLEGSDADDVIQGSSIYKLFADVVDYSEVFRGVRKVVGRGSESAGRVVKKYSGETWLDTPLCDSFCQVAGVFVNCMTQRSDGDAFISNGVERVVRSPFICDFEGNPEVFDVLTLHQRPTDRSFYSDVFIFDHRTSQLLGVILGIQYQRVSKIAMAKLLARLTPGAEQPRPGVAAPANKYETIDSAALGDVPVQSSVSKPTPSVGSDVRAKITAVLSDMVGVEQSKITDSTNLPDLGIDSLMGMEIARELESVFKCTLDMSAMMSLTEFGDLVKWVRGAVGESEDDDSVAELAALRLGHVSNLENTEPSTASSSPPLSVDYSPSETDLSSRAASPKVHSDTAARQAAVNFYVERYSRSFLFPPRSGDIETSQAPVPCCVLITGATGSLGAHLVEQFAKLESVSTVICFNRPGSMDPVARQHQALAERGIQLENKTSAKLQVIASDTSKPLLGLDETAYAKLVQSVTLIVHNAWPMSITRSIAAFEKQFMAMRNLIDLARDASYKLPSTAKVGFQFISSIASVGLYPVVTGKTIVPEEPSSVQYALHSGYSDAKLVCEKLVSATLNAHQDRVDAMVVRVGQVAGSRTSGYWNTAEHLSLLVKSAKTLNAIPDLPGQLSWLPVNDVASTLSDLLLTPSPSPHASGVYHVENPTRQPWSEIISLLASELNIEQVIPYDEWLERVKGFPKEREKENPAVRVMVFLEKEFLRMACGGIVLGTEKARERSQTLKSADKIERDTIARFVRWWKGSGLL